MRPYGRVSRAALGALGVAGVALAIVAVRVVRESERELEAGEQRLRRAEDDLAAAHFARAVRWYAPANPYPPRALGRLLELAAAADRRSDHATALARYRLVRAAVLSVRGVGVPFPQALALSDERIADLMARQPPAPVDADRPFEERRAAFARELAAAAAADPSAGWTLVMLAGFATWVCACFGFAVRAIDGDDRLRRMEARGWGLAWLVGMTAWVLGLVLA